MRIKAEDLVYFVVGVFGVDCGGRREEGGMEKGTTALEERGERERTASQPGMGI